MATVLASATVGMAFGATNNLGGLHIGLGVNVAFDKYDADITAGKRVDDAIKTVKTTSVNTDAINEITNASNLVNGLNGYNGTSLTSNLTVMNADGAQAVVNATLGEKTVTVTAATYKAIGKLDDGEDITFADGSMTQTVGLDSVQATSIKHNEFKYQLTNGLTSTQGAETTINGTTGNIENINKTAMKITSATEDSEVKYKLCSNGASDPLYGNEKTITYNGGWPAADSIADGSGVKIQITGATTDTLAQFSLSGTGAGTATTANVNTNDNDHTDAVAVELGTFTLNSITCDQLPTCTDINVVYKQNGQFTYTYTQDGRTVDDTDNKDITFAAVEASQITVSNVTAATYLLQQSLRRRGTNVGGELKLAYFHDFGNNLMIGVDLTGSISSKNKKNVRVGELNVTSPAYPDLTLSGAGGREIATATTEDGSVYTTTSARDARIDAGEELTLSNRPAYEAANPGMKITTDADGVDYVTADGTKELAFEKGVFNPRLAFVIGGTVGNWFAGVRTGVSYTTGKVKASDMTNSKSVSISSPFIGLHVMRQMSDKVHMYMTADWNIGDGRRTVDMNGIKSFKQSGYNISAGLTWRCKFGQ